MEYQKIINFLDKKPNQSTKFRTKNWVKVNDDARGMYNTNSQLKCKTSILKSSWCDYSEAYTLVSGIISIEYTSAAGTAANNTNKNIKFKNCAPFLDCVSKINNTQVDNAKDIDIIMLMYNLIGYSDNYLKTSLSLWQHYRDEPSLNNNGNIVDFTCAVFNSKSFKYKQKITGKTDDDSDKKC